MRCLLSVAWRPRLFDGGQDLRIEARVAAQELDPLRLQPGNAAGVLLGAPGSLVEASRLEQLHVLDTWKGRCDEIAEVRVTLPGDRPLGDRLDDRPRVLDRDLFRARVALRASDAPGVEQEDVEVAALHQVEEAIGLLLVAVRVEGVRAGDAE